jgi:hypothetical protein
MNTVYAVRAIPPCDAQGSIRGWARVDLFTDDSKPTDLVILRDGSASSQEEAAESRTPWCRTAVLFVLQSDRAMPGHPAPT